MIEVAISFLAEVAVKSTALILMAAMACWIARRSPAAARHRIWCSALAGVAALPLVMLLVPRWGVPVLPAEPARAPSLVVDRTDWTDRTEAAFSVSPEPRAPLEQRFPWKAALVGFYVAGAAASALGLAHSLRRLWRLTRESSPAAERPLRTLEFVATLLGISPPCLRVARQAGPAVPMTWGARRPVLLLPFGADAWPEEYLRSALAHEAAHIRRRDWTVQVAVRALCILYWFHPLARWAAARLRIEAERACDDLALLSGIPAADYAACLLEVTRMNREDRPDRQLALAALPMAQSTALGERLRAVLDAEAQRQERRRGIGGVIAAAALTAVLLTGALQATPSRPSAARTTDLALGTDTIRGRTSVKVAKKSKASLQAEVSALRTRLRATEAEVRRLRSQGSKSGMSLYDAKLGEGGGQVTIEEKRRLDLRVAEVERAAAAEALARSQERLRAASEQARAETQVEGSKSHDAAVSDLRERARLLEALNAENAARAKVESDLRSRQEAYERAFRAQTDALKRRAAERDALEGRKRAEAPRSPEAGDLHRRGFLPDAEAKVRADIRAREEAGRSGQIKDPARGSGSPDSGSLGPGASGGRGLPGLSEPSRLGGDTLGGLRGSTGLGGDSLGGGLSGRASGLGGDSLGRGPGGRNSGLGGEGLSRLPGGRSGMSSGIFGGADTGGRAAAGAASNPNRTSGMSRGTAVTAPRGSRNPNAISNEEELEDLQDQVRHIDLDIQLARRRLERAQQRVKAGIAQVDEAEEAELKLEHLALDKSAVLRRIERLKAPARRSGGAR